MFVTIKQFSLYSGFSPNTSSKLYKMYLEILGKDQRQKLTVYDLSKIDSVPVEEVKSILKIK